MFSRRFILSLFGVLLFLLSFRMRPAVANIFFKPKKKMKPRILSDLFTEGDKSLVSAAGSGTVKEMIREAVSSIGGFERLNIKGKRVLVKPNCVSGEKNPAKQIQRL